MPADPWADEPGYRTIHYAEFTEEVRAGDYFGGGREGLPYALLIVYDERDSGGFVLITWLDAEGAFGGDTWHPTLEEALGQAEFQYVGLDWTGRPPG